MEKRTTHNAFRDITHTLISLANGDADEGVKVILIEARQETAMMILDESRGRIANPSGDIAVRRILAVISRHVLDQAIKGAPNIIYCNQASALGFHKENGSLAPMRFNTMSKLLPVPGLDLGEESDNDIQISLRMFGFLIENGTLSPEKVGKCPICTRYFISQRSGQRRSRACSKAHQAVLVARELRSGHVYRDREKERNARRMAAVRTAERLVSMWKEERKSSTEVSRLLWSWNEENGSILGKRSINTILEKGG